MRSAPQVPHLEHFAGQLPKRPKQSEEPPRECLQRQRVSEFIGKELAQVFGREAVARERDVFEGSECVADLRKADGGAGPIGEVAVGLQRASVSCNGDVAALDIAQ